MPKFSFSKSKPSMEPVNEKVAPQATPQVNEQASQPKKKFTFTKGKAANQAGTDTAVSNTSGITSKPESVAQDVSSTTSATSPKPKFKFNTVEPSTSVLEGGDIQTEVDGEKFFNFEGLIDNLPESIISDFESSCNLLHAAFPDIDKAREQIPYCMTLLKENPALGELINDPLCKDFIAAVRGSYEVQVNTRKERKAKATAKSAQVNQMTDMMGAFDGIDLSSL